MSRCLYSRLFKAYLLDKFFVWALNCLLAGYPYLAVAAATAAGGLSSGPSRGFPGPLLCDAVHVVPSARGWV